MNKRVIKVEKGVTLVALVITIIVLLILAGISISMLTGENGIIKKATESKEKTEKADIIEQIQAEIISLQGNSISSEISDEDLKKILEEYGTLSGEEGVDLLDQTLTTNKNGYEIKVSDIWSGEVVSLQVGDIVTYSPSGTYNWQKEYCASRETPTGEDVTIESGAGKDFNITTWRVLSIENGKVELISANQTSGEVYLQGPQGYNNGVTMLNEACNSLYGNTEKNITARNIKIEDIEERMTETALSSAHASPYNEKVSSAYITYKNYPIIYAKEKLSIIDGTEKTDGLEMSEGTALISKTDEGSTDGSLTATTSIQPYNTYWYKDNTFMQTAFKKALDTEEDGTTNINYDLLLPKGASTSYWIASRCVATKSNYAGYSICMVAGGACYSNGLYVSPDEYYAQYDFNGEKALRPIVTLDSSLITKVNGADWVVSE